MLPAQSILVIDDEDSICLAFKQFFEARGWQVHAAASVDAGLSAHRQLNPAIVFLDVRLPDGSGLNLLDEIAGGDSAIVVITAYGGLDTVVRALHGKAQDYLVKPLDLDKALSLANRLWESRRLLHDATCGPSGGDMDFLVGDSPQMQEVYKLIARAAASSSPVLIQGETGTGKELVARAIHRFSERRHKPFVALNCGAIPDNLIESELFGHVKGAFTGADAERTGRFERANGGCLLLDEIGELPLPVQVKLLRVLDDGIVERVGSSQPLPLDVRIVAVTNKNLEQEVQRGRFRADLYYRLAVLHISLPPLRRRKADIIPIATHFLQAACGTSGSAPGLSTGAARILMACDWPGNVRQLKNAVEHAAAMAPDQTILPEDLPASVRRRDGAAGCDEQRFNDVVIDYAVSVVDTGGNRCRQTLDQAERALIEFALKQHRGNQSEAADYLGLHRNTLRNKIRELGIDRQTDEAPGGSDTSAVSSANRVSPKA